MHPHSDAPPRDTRDRLVLIGGGGHALVVADAAEASGRRLAGFLDDNAQAPLGLSAARQPHAPCIGGLLEVDRVRGLDWIVALGDLELRRRALAAVLHAFGPAKLAATVVHPRAFVSETGRLEAGVFVGPGAVIHTRAHVREHAIINTGAIVEHECDVGANTHVAPGAVLGGACTVGDDTLIGLGARVLPGVRIGTRCVVGAGAVVIRDVPDGQMVVGVPAASL